MNDLGNCTVRTGFTKVPSIVTVLLVMMLSLPALAALPDAPIIGKTSAGNGQVMVHFSPPASDGGSAIIDYTVTSAPGGLTATGSASPITISGLVNGTVYTFTVTARNGSGSGPSSAASNNTTPRMYAPSSGTINNLVVFIRFSDQPQFSQPLSYYTGLFNTDGKSLKQFYLENSYGALTVNSFFPAPSPGSLSADGFSYVDVHPTSYYAPYNASSNPGGYHTGTEAGQRETELVSNALNAVKDQVPVGLNLDGDSDGYIDHITFEVYSSTANPQPVIFYSRATYDTSGSILLNGKQVGSYTWVAASQDSLPQYLASTEIHEMGHSFGYPDLRGNSGRTPVGDWDVMSTSKPVHSGAYLKHRFTNWVPVLPEITDYGIYSLNDLTQSSNNSYKIKLPNSSSEFLVLEYRKAGGPFEANLPGSGLCITRVNEAAGIWGNLGGPPFFLYYFRPGGTNASDGSSSNSFACLSADNGRIQFNDVSTPPCFLSDGSPCGISIDAIGSASGSSITFSVTDPATTVIKRLISGYLYNGGNRVAGATVTLTGDASAVTTTDNLGRYMFLVAEGGSYTVTPAKTNMTFAPSSSTYTTVTADQTQNYAGTKVTHTISGTVTSAGAPMNGVPVIINCPQGGNYVGSMQTDQAGFYSFVVDAGSSCSVWPSKLNYNFSPSSKAFSTLSADQSQDFATHSTSVTLSGTITSNGNKLSGVTVSCPGADSASSVTTDGNGAYSFTVTIGAGSGYTVTPTDPAYSFSPPSRVYTGLVGSQTQNFTATATYRTLTVSITGSGGGTVTSNPGTISCAAGTCPEQFIYGSTVILTPTADAVSEFSGWTGACTGSGGCSTAMTADRDVIAIFTKSPVAKNMTTDTSYNSLALAVSEALSGQEIRLLDAQLDEVVSLGKAITLRGGWNSDYQSRSGLTTTLNGDLSIQNGISGAEMISVKGVLKIQGGCLQVDSVALMP